MLSVLHLKLHLQTKGYVALLKFILKVLEIYILYLDLWFILIFLQILFKMLTLCLGLFLTNGYLIVLTHLLKIYPKSNELPLCLCQKSVVIFVCIYFWVFCCHALYVHFFFNQYYTSLIDITLEECRSSNFALLQFYVGHTIPFIFSYDL